MSEVVTSIKKPSEMIDHKDRFDNDRELYRNLEIFIHQQQKHW